MNSGCSRSPVAGFVAYADTPSPASAPSRNPISDRPVSFVMVEDISIYFHCVTQSFPRTAPKGLQCSMNDFLVAFKPLHTNSRRGLTVGTARARVAAVKRPFSRLRAVEPEMRPQKLAAN